MFPAFIRFLLVFGLFSVVPGELLLRRLAPGQLAAPEIRFPTAFLAGLSVFVVLSWVCWLTSVSFQSFVAISQMAAALMFLAEAGAAFIKNEEEPRPRSSISWFKTPRNFVYAGIAVGLALLFVVAPPVLDHRGDGFVHLGYLRSIASDNSMTPAEVLGPAVFAGDEVPESDPRSGALHPLLSGVARLSSIDPLTLWRWLPVVLAPVAFLSFAGFAVALLPGTGFVAVALVLFLMFQGGIGRQFLGSVGYGQHLSLVFYWVLLVLCLRFAKSRGGATLAIIGLITFGGGLVHIDVVIHVAFMFAGLLVGARVFGFTRGGLIRLGAVIGVLSGIALAWKYFGFYGGGNIIHTHPHGLLYFFRIGDPFFIPNPGEIIRKNGLLFFVALFFIVFLPFLGKHKRYGWMNFSLSIPIVVTALNPFVAPLLYAKANYLVHRFLLGIPALVIFALATGALVSWARRGGLFKRAVAAVCLLMLVKPFVLSAGAFLGDVRSIRTERGRPPVNEELLGVIEYINQKIPKKSVVLTDAVTGYALSAFSDARVVAVLGQHGNPNDRYAVERLNAIHRTLSPYTTQIEAINEIKRFGVEYVLVNSSFSEPYHDFLADWDPGFKAVLDKKFGGLKEVFKRVYHSERTALYEVVGFEFERVSWHPVDPFETAPDSRIESCDVSAAGGGPRVTGIRFDPRSGLPGESVRVTLAYRGAEEYRPELPMSLRLRFEDREYFDLSAEYPGDKYVRRYRERRDGAFRRFRIDHRPFGGYYRADEWPLSRDCFEVFDIRLPRYLNETNYEVQLQLVEEPLLPNYSVRDFLFNDDSRVGEACAEIEIKKYLVR